MRTWNSSQIVGNSIEATPTQLTDEQIDIVNGGILPVVGFGIALASHVGVGGAATTVTGHILSGVGLGIATFGLARYLGGGGANRYRISHSQR